MPSVRSIFARHKLPLLLVACYVAGRFLPAPGVWLHELPIAPSQLTWLAPTMAQLLVAVLLYAAAVAVDWRSIVDVARRPLLLAGSVAAVWIVPTLVVRVASQLLVCFGDDEIALPLAVGFALVAAMPVANSAAAWTQQSRGNLSFSLSLIVISIVVAPWMVPLALRALGTPLDGTHDTMLRALTQQLAGVSFIVWVLLPTLAGLLTRAIAGDRWVEQRHTAFLIVASATALLLLNYMNAAIALPKLAATEIKAALPATLLISGLVCVSGHLVALALRAKVDVPTTRAIGYALGMKHTGLALALAAGALASEPLLIVPIITTTLVQHVVSATFHAFASETK